VSDARAVGSKVEDDPPAVGSKVEDDPPAAGSVDRRRPAVGRIGEQRLHVCRVESVGPVAKLAGHGDGALFLQNVANLCSTERAQQPRDPALVAAAFELHPCAAEQSQVMLGEAPLEQLLDRTSQQIRRAQLLDAALSLFPGLFELGLIRRRSARHLLNEEPGTALIVSGENQTGRQLL